MIHPSIRIEGAILSPDLFGRIEELPGQKPADFGMVPNVRVKDEIARAWADAQDYWRIFRRRLDSLRPDSPATGETRQLWMVPLFGLLGYQPEYQAQGTELNGKTYTLSHRMANRAAAPVQIVGYREPAGLDRKPERSALRMSAHAMVQEYLNLGEQLYGLVTNGRLLRLLRDSSRLVRQSYLEFDLERIFSDGLFADFAILFRLLHATRLPLTDEGAAQSLIERYHQDSLDSGARIRDGLSRAVEEAIHSFGNGFLNHPANEELRRSADEGQLKPEDFYQQLLRLIYRLLFLMVIEERDLVFPADAGPALREVYRRYYSVQRLRQLSEKRWLADPDRHDLWLALTATFQLFEDGGPGARLGLAPLAGDLFRADAIGPLARCTLGNDVLMRCLRSLGLYEHPDTHQQIRVNYGALNVEEFGSVYEGLLEYEPRLGRDGAGWSFHFDSGSLRAVTGSHYTPDELVQPLVAHSLEHLIRRCLAEKDPEQALLELRVADIACGSGHILLAAARRIAAELAVVRTGEDQPSPTAFRTALRDVIRTCIYGVDLNPLAVELCKVALWLEAHVPGEPLGFLDHHVKCGNAIIGVLRREDLDRGVPDEAFVAMPGDDKEVGARWRKANKAQRKQWAAQVKAREFQVSLPIDLQRSVAGLSARWRTLSALPERTPAEVEQKKRRFVDFYAGREAWLMGHVAAIPLAQFYTAKTQDHEKVLIGDEAFRDYWPGGRAPQGPATGHAWALAVRKRFFHWFLEFPEILERGGFDCILGNPPYLGGQALSRTYGHSFCSYVKWEYAPAGLSDLVVFFVRRIFELLRPEGFAAFLTTNSIKDGDIRKDGLEQVLARGGALTMAVRGIKWPGRANLVVSQVALHKGAWKGRRVLDGREVGTISAYFEDTEDGGEPAVLEENRARMFQGVIINGDGFLLAESEAARLMSSDPLNEEVLFPVINGQEITNLPDQRPVRWVINFQDWEQEKARKYAGPFEIVERMVKPGRLENQRVAHLPWWQYERSRAEMFRETSPLPRCFVASRTAKHLNFSAVPTRYVVADAFIFADGRWEMYAVVQSTLHEIWARKYSGALKQDLRYSASKCFETFPFPKDLWQSPDPDLARGGAAYHEHRNSLMSLLWLGLTDIYNLFHARQLSPAQVAQVSRKPAEVAEQGYRGLLELRRLHEELDRAVQRAYGWGELELGHGFVEVETLPENDRVRYTISPAARREVLRRLLVLNRELAR